LSQCTYAFRLPRDDRVQLRDRPVDVVVRHDVVELPRLLHLPAREVEPLADLAGALGRPLPEPPLELREARGGDEDRHGVRTEMLDAVGAVGLELEDAAAAGLEDPIDLGVQRAVPSADEDDVLEEGARADLRVELLVGEKVVLPPVPLSLAAQPGGGGDGDLQVASALDEAANEGSLPGSGGAGDDEELQRRRSPTSSAR